MTTHSLHQPTPEFRDFLEDEIVHSFRRHRAWRRLRGLAVVFASLAIGLTAGLAPAQIREGAQRESLLYAANSELQLVGLRLDLARAQLADVTAKVNAGVLGAASLGSVVAEVRRMEALAMRATLNVQEITATGLPVRDDLTAPRVGNKDYVMERIRMDLFVAQQQLTAAEAALADAERRERAGAGADVERMDAELQVVFARGRMGVLAEQQKLRAEFLAKGTPGDQLSRRLQRQQLRMDAMTLDKAVQVARQRLDLVRRQRTVGVASELDLLRAEVEVKERETEMMLLARQLRSLSPES